MKFEEVQRTVELRTSFRYLAPPARLHAGAGSISQIYSEAQRIGAKRAFIVASNTLSRTTNLVDKVREALREFHVGTFDGAKKESPIPTVMAGVDAVKAAKPDLIVVIGGGSAVITARAITIIVGEGKTIEEMYTKHIPGQAPLVYRADKPKIPNILVNTTPTTGADRGGAAVYDVVAPHRKELYDPKTRPLALIADPEALLTAPDDLYFATSLGTLSIGAIQQPDLTPLSFADYRQAHELALVNLPKLRDNPKDGEARLQLFIACYLINRASQSTYNIQGRNKTTGLGRQIRYMYPEIDQGMVGAAMLVTHMRINQEIMTEGQARLAEVLGVRRPGMSDMDAAEAAITYVAAFQNSLGLSTRLRDLGVKKEDFRKLAEMDVTEPGFGQGMNRVTDIDELIGILEMSW